MHSVMKRLHRRVHSVDSLNKLLFNEKFLDRSLWTALKSVNCEDLNETVLQLNLKRNEELQHLNDEQTSIDDSIKILLKNVSSVDKIKNADPTYYEHHVNELIVEITDFKENLKNKYLTVKDIECSLENEVDILNKICLKYEKDNFYNSLDVVPVLNFKRSKKSPVINKDIENFQEFLFRHGGHTGGWGEEEHKIFIRCWHKSKLHNRDSRDMFNGKESNDSNENMLFSEVGRMLPEKSVNDIISHALWQIKYNSLKRQQSEAIANWKIVNSANQIKDIVSSQRKKLYNESLSQWSDDVKEWQELKRAEERNVLEQKADCIINEREHKIMKEIKRKKNKRAINDWIQMKMTDDKNDTFGKQETIIYDPSKIKVYRERDRIKSNDRSQAISKYRENRSKSLSCLNASIDKGSRRYSLERKGRYADCTKQWKLRIARNTTRASSENIPSVDDIPKLKVPTWCEGMNVR